VRLDGLTPRAYCPAHGRAATAGILGFGADCGSDRRRHINALETPSPGPVGSGGGGKISPAAARPADTSLVGIAADTLDSLNDAIASFRRSESWAKLQPIVFQVVGHQSFGLGVVYGIAENVIGSVVELAQLAKTFLLADLYDRAHQSSLSAATGRASAPRSPRSTSPRTPDPWPG
jgi:hypothetical protein